MEEEKVKSFDEVEEILCPHCGENMFSEPRDGFITFWGEESIDEDCQHCGKKVYIQEFVSRSWHVAKNYSDI